MWSSRSLSMSSTIFGWVLTETGGGSSSRNPRRYAHKMDGVRYRHIIEDATLIKYPAEGTTKVHIRFKGGKTETLRTLNPKSSAQQM
jgi:hypothetical protein